MTNRKTTKRALLSSVLALILCFAMLLGSTWAWFTDTATTNVNTIKSGTLDVMLVDDESGADLKDTLIDFYNGKGSKDLLWEPGVSFATKGFKVVNNGTLALTFEIVVSGANVNLGLSKANLLNVIEFKIVNAENFAKFNDPANYGWDDIEEADFTANVKGVTLVTPNGGASPVYYIIAHMDEAAGNEYQNCTLDGVAVTVYANQATYEEDSHGNGYDEDAIKASDETINTLVNVLAQDGVQEAKLNDNAVAGSYIELNGKTLDGNGKTITAIGDMMSNGKNTDPVILATSGVVKNLTIDGAGRGVGTRGALEGDLTIDNYKANGGSYALHVGSGASHNLTVKNSQLYGWTSFGTGFNSVTFENTKFAESTTGYNNIRAYNNVTFKNCDFTNTIISQGDNSNITITLVNCTYNGVAITADMIAGFQAAAQNIGHKPATFVVNP